MLTYCKFENGKLVYVDGLQECEVVQAVAPTAVEIGALVGSLGIPMEFLTAATDRDERPRFEAEEGHKLLVIRVPHRDAASATPYVTLAFAIILTPDRLITVCAEDTALWGELLSSRTRIPSPRDPLPFLLTLFLHVARQYLSFLNSIRHESEEVEKAIHGSMKNQTLVRMLNLGKCLVYFTTSLRANEPMWDRMRRIAGRDLTEEEQDLLDDVRVEFGQARDLADIYSNILNGMMDAFASIISNNVSTVMKLLASITIVLMLPTLVTSTLGMNVRLPFGESPYAFWITISVSMVLSTIAVIAFLRMKIF
ncbi:MAG: magnesium transporter CorA family protein [Candidatus Bipolaricaulota bacterium]|nr:magnesium transporter CorA family protein [Candidatus Bipolaricaulota bacterium]